MGLMRLPKLTRRALSPIRWTEGGATSAGRDGRRGNVYARAFEGCPYAAGDFGRVGGIAVDAEGADIERQLCAVMRYGLALGQVERLGSGLLRLGNHGVRISPIA